MDWLLEKEKEDGREEVHDTGFQRGARMTPIQILAAIDSGALLGPSMFDSVDCDAALEALDASPAYEAKWVGLKEAVDRAWELAAPSPAIRELAERIRKHVFLTVSRASREHDIAAWVSDDFDLIVRGRVTGLTDPFLEALWAAYQNHRLPSPDILAGE
jgi:hypothetical protein